MYRCSCCGYLFNEPVDVSSIEPRGKYWGLSAYATVYEERCPRCLKEDFEGYEEDEE